MLHKPHRSQMNWLGVLNMHVYVLLLCSRNKAVRHWGLARDTNIDCKKHQRMLACKSTLQSIRKQLSR